MKKISSAERAKKALFTCVSFGYDIIQEMKLLAMILLLSMAAFVTKLVAHVFDCYAEIAKGVV